MRLEQPAAARHLLFESAEHPVIQVEPNLKSSRRLLEFGLQMVQPHSRVAMPQWRELSCSKNFELSAVAKIRARQ
jgi:hypothetical protein